MNMETESTFSQIKHYCKHHPQTIFDVAQVLQAYFPSINAGSFRKFVSRLVQEGALIPISKGVYYIGQEFPENVEEIILNHYCGDRPIFYAKESLLYHEGIIENKPDITKLYVAFGLGNKTIGNVMLIQSKSACDFFYTPEKLTLLELLDSQKLVPEDNLGLFSKSVINHCQRMANEAHTRKESISYPRITYIKLAKALDKCHISNSVMSDYENGTELLSDKELPRV